jgi:hypothetical protein
MTDFRALCQELMDAIDSGVPVERIKQSPLAVRVDAALAQPEPQGPMPEVDDILRLAAIIRRVDGNYDKGAAALAEAILSHPDSRWQHAQPEPQGPSETAWALAQLLDGVQRHDLPNMTGLSDSDCDRIWAARPAIEPVPGVEGADA